LSASQAYATFAIIELVTGQLMTFLGLIPSMAAALGNITRIQDYMETDDSPNVSDDLESSQQPLESLSGFEVPDSLSQSKGSEVRAAVVAKFEHTTIAYSQSADAFCLTNVSLHIEDSRIYLIQGEVGRGKTLLLKALLREAFIEGGHSLFSDRSTAFCQQEPWIRHETIVESVTAGAPFDAAWFTHVCHVCAMDVDMKTFEGGISYDAGNRGSRLSGGQRQRLVIHPKLHIKIVSDWSY